MPTPLSDEAFARNLLQTRILNADQVQAAQDLQSAARDKGEVLSLAEILIRQGVITSAIRENVEKMLQGGHAVGLQSLGHYKLLKKLGEGGMGTVYLADDTSIRRRVALKVLPRRFASDPEFLARFKREARAIGRLNHPNIIAAYTTDEHLGFHYMAMEYCDGDSLDRVLKKQVSLPWKTAVAYALQITAGLKHAHDHGIIHRDIKPSNIFVTREGAVKILDMGLSKNIGTEESAFTTASGVAIGTPHYISPEQARGERQIDGRADIYSLGATLYHIITGQTPFAGDSAALIMLKHVTDRIQNPKDLCPELPDSLVQVIVRMMAKNPADRYANCDDLSVDLENVLAGRPVKAPPLSHDKSSIARPGTANPQRPAPLVRPIWLGAAALVLIACGVLFYVVWKSKKTTSADTPIVVSSSFVPSATRTAPGVEAPNTVVTPTAATSVVVPNAPKEIPKETAVQNPPLTPVIPVAVQPVPPVPPVTQKSSPETPPTPVPEPPPPPPVAVTHDKPTPKPPASHAPFQPPEPGANHAAEKPETVLLAEEFAKLNPAKLPRGWSAPDLRQPLNVLPAPGGGSMLLITNREGDVADPRLEIPLDMDQVSHCKIHTHVLARCPSGYSASANPFAKPRLVVMIDRGDKTPLVESQVLEPTDRDWKDLDLTVRIPPDAKHVTVSLKVSNIKAEAFFEDLKVEVFPEEKLPDSVLVYEDFESLKLTDLPAGWSLSGPKQAVSIVEIPEFGRLLRINNTDKTVSSILRLHPDLEKVRGRKIHISAWICSPSGYSPPASPSWAHPRLSLIIERPPDGKKTYKDARLEAPGTDWKWVAFTAEIPEDATQVTVEILVSNVVADALFDNFKIELMK